MTHPAFAPNIFELAERLEAEWFDPDELREIATRIATMHGREVLDEVLEVLFAALAWEAGTAEARLDAIVRLRDAVVPPTEASESAP